MAMGNPEQAGQFVTHRMAGCGLRDIDSLTSNMRRLEHQLVLGIIPCKVILVVFYDRVAKQIF